MLEFVGMRLAVRLYLDLLGELRTLPPAPYSAGQGTTLFLFMLSTSQSQCL